MIPYACHNKPRPVAGVLLTVQDGYHNVIFSYEDGSSDRMPRMVTIPFVGSTDCQYRTKAPDPRCAGCQHINHGNDDGKQ